MRFLCLIVFTFVIAFMGRLGHADSQDLETVDRIESMFQKGFGNMSFSASSARSVSLYSGELSEGHPSKWVRNTRILRGKKGATLAKVEDHVYESQEDESPAQKQWNGFQINNSQAIRAVKNPESDRLKVNAFAEIEQPKKKALGGQGIGVIFDGMLPADGGLSFTEILHTSETVEIDESVKSPEGEDAVKIRIEGPHGSYRFWLDPDQGYLPRQISVEKEANDRYLNSTVAEQEITDHRQNPPSTARLSGFRVVISDINIKRIDGTPVVTHANSQKTLRTNDGEERVVTSVFNRSDIQLSPDFEESDFQLDIPNGTPVEFSETGVDYVWRDGDIAVAFDPAVIDGIEDQVASVKKKSHEDEGGENQEVQDKVTPENDEPSDESDLTLLFILGGTLLCLGGLAVYWFVRKRGP